ncbi:low molecular weight phosphatase family protein [Arcanobacterium bovis]|uniref:Low molecular weight phosphatase family protein n=1 Tax=Arcanobacterium bovis TaxID=2529275 RepID=A0A4Q9UZL5_9ACTO|nr:low molecular weight phosphatase family protein [Arcanobacterium bovis]TBW21469.1 low molecular weight phosphatase family protein [Arcanobacterium bovis]
MPQPDTTQPRPKILFICVKNAGKSQMAAALMRHMYAERVDVTSAGTHPGTNLNSESEQSIQAAGASFEGEFPKAIDADALRCADAVVIIGKEAQVEPVPGMKAQIERWETDEPSLRGIDGAERMNMIRDELCERVQELGERLFATCN